MSVVSMKALLEAGVHFGHRTRRWNPKMKPFIFTERNGIHIIDLQQTLSQLDRAYSFVQETAARGGSILLVGTKKQAQDTIAQEAARCEMPYVNQRWLGGTLTNWRTIRQRIDQMIELESRQARGEFNRLTKKEALEKQQLIAKLQRRLGGLRSMSRLPDIVFVTDTHREDLAVSEANKLNIPLIALVDTNCDPGPIDLVIPANDDAIRAIKLIVGKIADAAIEGMQLRATLEAEAAEALEESEEREAEMAYALSEGKSENELYLAGSTLERVRSGQFSDRIAAAAAGDGEGDDSPDNTENAPPASDEDEDS